MAVKPLQAAATIGRSAPASMSSGILKEFTEYLKKKGAQDMPLADGPGVLGGVAGAGLGSLVGMPGLGATVGNIAGSHFANRRQQAAKRRMNRG